MRRHRDALEKKEIRSTSDLLRAVWLDLLKAYSALAEIHYRTATHVVRRFLADHPGNVPEILCTLDQPHLRHLGLEVHEPTDTVFPGFYHWAKQSSRWLGMPTWIDGTSRFPSSAYFA